MKRQTAAILALLFSSAIVAADDASEGPVQFRATLNDKPLEFKYRKGQPITPQVESFRQSGVNPYSGDTEAIEAGSKIYKKLCQACHLKDGTGRIGPNLTDEHWSRPRTHSDVGRFEIIYGGGAGAMQPFGRRIDQDDILKVMAFIDTFRAD